MPDDSFRSRADVDYLSLLFPDRVHGGVYTEPRIFDDELDRIFHRGWVYVGHESEIPNPGDYQSRHVGRQPVIFVRGEDGQARVLMNRCTHRGPAVCVHEAGNTKRFVCPYHGWAFGNTGALIGVPHAESYDETFRREDFGLRPAPRVAAYRGLTFASLAHDGISLDEHLGPLAKAEIDKAADQAPSGEIDVSCGVHKYAYDGNWKLQLENSADGYHLGYLHRAYLRIMTDRAGVEPPNLGGSSPIRIRSLGNGHLSWSEETGVHQLYADPQYRAALVAGRGEARAQALGRYGGPHFVIFPNLVCIQSHLRIIRPISVGRTEVSLYPYRLTGAPDWINTARLTFHQGFYGPAGGGATDDLEVFERITEGLRASFDPWVWIHRGLGREVLESDGSISAQFTDELNNRTILQHWQKLMLADVFSVS